MADLSFTRRAAVTLDRLEEGIERAAEGAGVDVEIARSDNLIELEFDDGSKIVINSHEAAGEIWVAARAGGFHFRPAPDGGWIDGRSGRSLAALLSEQIGLQAGSAMSLEHLDLSGA